MAQLEACVLSKDEVLGSKPRYSTALFAWSIWSWRSPNTREVPSSSLGANTFVLVLFFCFPLCFFFVGGWGTKYADYSPHLGKTLVPSGVPPPTPKPPWHHNQTHNQSHRSCSLCSEEALGMIGTFINHCRETIKAVDLSHTSFFKTG